MESDRGAQQKVAKPDVGSQAAAPEATGRPKNKPSTAPGKRKKAPRHVNSSPPGNKASTRPALQHPNIAEEPLPGDRLTQAQPKPAQGVSWPATASGRAPTSQSAGRRRMPAVEQDSEDSFALHFTTDEEDEQAFKAAVMAQAKHPARAKTCGRLGKPSSTKEPGNREPSAGVQLSPLPCVKPPYDYGSEHSVPTVCDSPLNSWRLKGYSSTPQVRAPFKLRQPAQVTNTRCAHQFVQGEQGAGNTRATPVSMRCPVKEASHTTTNQRSLQRELSV